MIIRGGHGDDNLTGTSGDDTFNLTAGGNDTASGGDGNDVFWMGASLNAGDKIDGGDGTDRIDLNGDYSAGLVLAADTITNIEQMFLAPGHSYNLTFNDGNVAARAHFMISAGGLGAADQLVFDGSAETNGYFTIYAGAGDDIIYGGQKVDIIRLQQGGNDTVHAGGGPDLIVMGASFTAADQIDGGSGDDTVTLDGTGTASITFTATTMTNVELLTLGGGHPYTLITNDATVAHGQTLTVDATGLAHTDALVFDGSAETDGSFVFDLGAGFTASDSVIGGAAGNDTASLDGDYSGANALMFGPTTMENIEDLVLAGGHAYDITTDDGTVALGQTLTVDARGLDKAHVLTFDGSAETNGSFVVEFGAGFAAADTIAGGAGADTLELSGAYSGANALTFGATTMTGVETLKLGSGFSYNLTTNDATVASGQTLTVDASALDATHSLIFNGAAETDGSFVIIGGAGTDIITGGNGSDTITGGGGLDIFNYSSVAQSDWQHTDRITDFDADSDLFNFGHLVTAVAFDSGTVDDLNASLAGVIGADLVANGAVMVTATGGALDGHIFLVIDGNDTAGYTAGSDWVIDITGAAHLADLATSNFI